jgi:hypothetical protein
LTATLHIAKPGIYKGMKADTYFGDPCPHPSLTQSIAKLMLEQSPLHAWAEHPRLGKALDEDADEEKYNKAKAIGSAAHTILLGRGKLIAIGKFDSWRSKEAIAFKTKALSEGATPILEEHHGAALLVAERAREQLDKAGWKDAFRDGDGELVLAWTEGEGEDRIWLRTMIDWATPDLCALYDLKTSAGSFAPQGLGFKIDDDGWDVQAAMHERGLAVLDKHNAGRRTFRFAALEQSSPFALVPVQLSEHHLALGRRKLAVAINLWRQCMKAKQWPGYGEKPVTPNIPQPRESRWIEREISNVESGVWSLDDPIILGAPVETRAPKMVEPV